VADGDGAADVLAAFWGLAKPHAVVAVTVGKLHLEREGSRSAAERDEDD
jgi:hypothetical protein